MREERQVALAHDAEMVQFVPRDVERQAAWRRAVTIDLPRSPPGDRRQGTKESDRPRAYHPVVVQQLHPGAALRAGVGRVDLLVEAQEGRALPPGETEC